MKRLILALAVLSSVSCSSQNGGNTDMKIVAHRGGALIGNENTLSAFSKGLEAGADMIELDVHLTSDGAVVVCHDDSIDRTTDGKGRIEDMTLDQFKSAKALDRESGQPTEEPLPTLEEALDLIHGKAGILLEIKKFHKGQYEGIEQKVLDLVNAKGMHDDVTLQSFDDSILRKIHELDPGMRIEKLIICRPLPGLCIDNGLSTFSFRKYDFCASINSMRVLTSRHFVKKCHKAGKEIKIWTVNSPDKVIPGVDAVISNRPDLFRK